MSDAVWAKTTKRLISIMEGRADYSEGLLEEGQGSDWVPEYYARALASAAGQDLALVLPLVLAALSGCTHGGLMAWTRLAEGMWLPTPLVVQAFLLARSGVGKSSLIGEVKPVVETALRASLKVQAGWVEAQRQNAGPALANATDVTKDAWETIYATGITPRTLIGTGGTPEGTRNRLVRYGGHQFVLAGEPDILSETGAYRKDAGSVTFFLNGFDQDDIDVARATGDQHFPAVTLPMAVFLQPEVFATVTRERQFADRGMLHRVWLVSSLHNGLRPAFEISDVDPHKIASMDAATAALSESATGISARGCVYRSAKAVRKAWEDKMVSAGGLGGLSGLPEPAVARPERLTIVDQAAQQAYVALQNMHSNVFNEIRLIESHAPGTKEMFEPLAARITSHVLRWAALTALAADPQRSDLPAAAITDTATRVLPWLWGHWALVMIGRESEVVSLAVSEGVIRNPRGEDLGLAGSVLKGLMRLSSGQTLMGENGPWLARSEVLSRARSAVPKPHPPGVYRQLSAALDTLISEGKMVEAEQTLDAAGAKGAKVRFTALGLTTMNVA